MARQVITDNTEQKELSSSLQDSGAQQNPANVGVTLLDKPAWPDGTKKLRLTWVIYPANMRKEREGIEVPVRMIELILRAGSVVRRFSAEERYSITYATAMQRRGQGPPFTQDRVAELTMNGGGNLVMAVDRKGTELHLSEEFSSDGLCEPVPCPVRSVTLARFTVPAQVSIEEYFRVVEGMGNEYDEACERNIKGE